VSAPQHSVRRGGLARALAIVPHDRHFLIAAGVLALTLAGWGYAREGLGVVLNPRPVPWAAGVTVDADHRNTSLATAFGDGNRYRRVEGDGVLWNRHGRPERDGRPDGEIVPNDETLRILGVGSGYDHTRYPQRCSNWYVSRVYADTRSDALHRHWRLDVTYYTGGLNLVPHIPEVCLVAGGARILGSDRETFRLQTPREGWSGEIAFTRTRYVVPGRHGPSLRQDYYVFCLNGEPVPSREAVRLRLINPFRRHSYFAKIQFGPLREVRDRQATDRAAEAFIQAAIGPILKQLPTAEDVEALGQGAAPPPAGPSGPPRRRQGG
jgi:hypothetical protein